MKACYKTILLGDKANEMNKGISGRIRLRLPEEVDHYELVGELTHCCLEMKEAIDDNAIIFGNYDGYGRSNTVKIVKCHPYSEGASWDEYSISFCPFCGEKIETQETERIYQRKITKRIPSKRVVEYTSR